ncbi:hypothetical protein SUDANB151_00009 [Streptomyces sp. enrichment culture]
MWYGRPERAAPRTTALISCTPLGAASRTRGVRSSPAGAARESGTTTDAPARRWARASRGSRSAPIPAPSPHTNTLNPAVTSPSTMFTMAFSTLPNWKNRSG